VTAFGKSQLLRAAVVLAFPALWAVGPRRLLAMALTAAALAYVVGRLAVARSDRHELPLSSDLTPFGEGVMTAGAIGLALIAVHARDLAPFGLGAAVALAATFFVAHAVVLPRMAPGRPLADARRKIASYAGMVAEIGLLVGLLTLAAENLQATLAGPAGGSQLLTSPWPAVLGLGFAGLPVLQLSLLIDDGDPETQRLRAMEALAIATLGLLLVGWTGPRLWPG